MSLDTLPLEIGWRIWSNIEDPLDITNLVLVSQTIHTQGYVALQRHRHFQREYATVQDRCFSCHKQSIKSSRLFGLAKLFMRTPHIGLYVRVLELSSWHRSWNRTTLGIRRREHGCSMHTRYAENDMKLIEAALTSLLKPKKLRKWLRWLEKGDEAPIILIIFALCPRIQVLDIFNEDLHNDDLLELLSDIFVDVLSGTAVLPRLRDVRIGPFYCRETTAAQVLTFFTKHWPWLKTLSARDPLGYHEDDYEILERECIVPEESHLESLSLVAVEDMTLHDLRALIEPLQALRVFVYHPVDTPSFKLSELCKALLARAQESLETLSVNGFFIYSHAEWPDLGGYRSLKPFRTSLDLFFRDDQPTVMAKLPLSIQSVTVSGRQFPYGKTFTNFMSSIIPAKARLPKLTSVELSLPNDCWKKYIPRTHNAKASCAKAGFKLEILDKLDDVYY